MGQRVRIINAAQQAMAASRLGQNVIESCIVQEVSLYLSMLHITCITNMTMIYHIMYVDINGMLFPTKTGIYMLLNISSEYGILHTFYIRCNLCIHDIIFQLKAVVWHFI